MKKIRISKKRQYLFFFMLYLLGMIATVISFIEALEKKENFEIFARGLLIIFFAGWIIDNGLKYRKEIQNKKA